MGLASDNPFFRPKGTAEPQGSGELGPTLDLAQLKELRQMPGGTGGTLLDELVEILSRELPPDLDRIKGMVERRDVAAAQLAHRVAGSAATIGAARLRKVLHAVEQVSRKADWPAADALCTTLDQEWQITRDALKQAAEPPPL